MFFNGLLRRWFIKLLHKPHEPGLLSLGPFDSIEDVDGLWSEAAKLAQAARSRMSIILSERVVN